MSVFQEKIEGVPQFVSYFEPVHQALLHFGGQATARHTLKLAVRWTNTLKCRAIACVSKP